MIFLNTIDNIVPIQLLTTVNIGHNRSVGHSSTMLHQGKTKWLFVTRCRRRNLTTLQSTSRSMAERRTKYHKQPFYSHQKYSYIQLHACSVKRLIILQQLDYCKRCEFHFYLFWKSCCVFLANCPTGRLFCKMLIWITILRIAVVGYLFKCYKLLLLRICGNFCRLLFWNSLFAN